MPEGFKCRGEGDRRWRSAAGEAGTGGKELPCWEVSESCSIHTFYSLHEWVRGFMCMGAYACACFTPKGLSVSHVVYI